MKNQFKSNPLSIDELVTWKLNPYINPRTGKAIKENGNTYSIFLKSYNKHKTDVDKIIYDKQNNMSKSNNELKQNNSSNQEAQTNNSQEKILTMLSQCNEDRDPISMNIFWIEENGKRRVVYPIENLSELIFYNDSKNLVRCFERETLKYLKSYSINIHPISTEPIPSSIFDSVDIVNLTEVRENKTIENLALDVFQNFNKISIFIDYEWFLDLNKQYLLKFNYELKDFWLQNFSESQRSQINNEPLFKKGNDELDSLSLENIQKYLLSQIKILLDCDKEEFKYMINYIILGALGIVIPQIKEQYPDFLFSF